MKTLRIFYLEGCPYCAHARRAIAELLAEPDFAGTPVEWIEERQNAAIAEKFDYYYVPAAFDGERKLYEASPSHDYGTIRDNLRAALQAVRA